MRALLAVLALAALTAGCGSSGSRSEQGAPKPGLLEALWRQSGEAVALIRGTSDYSPGDVRVSFLVVDNRAHQGEVRRVSVREFERAVRADLH